MQPLQHYNKNITWLMMVLKCVHMLLLMLRGLPSQNHNTGDMSTPTCTLRFCTFVAQPWLAVQDGVNVLTHVSAQTVLRLKTYDCSRNSNE